MDDVDENNPKEVRATSLADGGGAGGSSGASGEEAKEGKAEATFQENVAEMKAHLRSLGISFPGCGWEGGEGKEGKEGGAGNEGKEGTVGGRRPPLALQPPKGYAVESGKCLPIGPHTIPTPRFTHRRTHLYLPVPTTPIADPPHSIPGHFRAVFPSAFPTLAPQREGL
jgi:hypothetical protein